MENNGLNLMPQCLPCILDKCHIVINLFWNFEAKMWKMLQCDINNQNLTFFCKTDTRLVQHPDIEVEKLL